MEKTDERITALEIKLAAHNVTIEIIMATLKEITEAFRVIGIGLPDSSRTQKS